MDNKKPTVSVVISIYQCGGLLKRCISSIIEQTFTDWELLLVNDGSEGESFMIAKEYAQRDSRIRLVENQHDGAGLAKNIGIREAAGKYLLFVDPDDFLDADLFDKLLSFTDDEHCIYEFGYIKEVFGFPPKKIAEKKKCAYPAEVKISDLLTYDGKEQGYCWNKLIDISKLNGKMPRFVEEYEFYGDFYWTFCLYRSTDYVVSLPVFGYHFNYRDDNTTNSVLRKCNRFKECDEVFGRIRKEISDDYSELDATAMVKHFHIFLDDFYRSILNNEREAISYMKEHYYTLKDEVLASKKVSPAKKAAIHSEISTKNAKAFVKGNRVFL